MIVLGIETCSPSGGAALFDGDCLLGSQGICSSRAHSRLIMPTVKGMLDELGLTVGAIGAVAVSAGPGSFTGVRVGMTLGKALCEAGRPRLVLVSTLEALALRAWSGEDVDAVVPLLNARKGEVYGAAFAMRGGAPARIAEDFVCAPEDVARRVAGRCLVAGEGARAWREQLRAALGDRLVEARPDRFDTSAEQVAVLGHREALAGRFADPATAGPTYLRDASVSTPKGAR